MKKQSHKKQRTSKCAINPATVYLESLAPSGKRSMRCQLQNAVRIIQGQGTVEGFKWQSLTYADVVNVRARLLEQNKSIHTVNLCLAAVRGVAQCAFHLGVLSAENLMHIKSVKRIPFHPLPSGRSLSEKELKRLLNKCQRDRSVRGHRDSALIATLATTGLRRAEIAALTLDQYDQKIGQLRVTNTKNQRDRLCPLPSIAKKTLRVWLNKRGDESGALFCRIRKNEQVTLNLLSSQAIYDIVKRRAEDAGIESVTPHDFRRTFVTRLLENNVDINIVCKLVGHSDIKTTCRYDHRTPNARKYIEQIISF